MLQAPTLKFLKDLNKNNNKTWFEKNKNNYALAKEDVENTVTKILKGFDKIDKEVAELNAKNCLFRIYRDVRFSKDKTPYKNNMGAWMNRGGKKVNSAGYYFHCEPGKSFLAGGYYMPMPPELNKIRQEIDYNFDEWKKIISSKQFKKQFTAGVDGIEILSRPPKGYDENNPAIEFLKMKNFVVRHPLTDKELLSPALIKEVLKTYEAMKPFVDFLNRAVSG
ncbi:MAG: DUF2461 domain-containing protein [Sphingobacteriales bacterium]|nr:DUF2461 domain-containing protein [Sphingobacteriales bacterium]